MNKKLKLAAVATAAAMVVVGLSGGGAQAAKWITGAQVKNESLTGADIRNGSIGAKELSKGIQQRLADVKKLKNGVDGKDGAPGAPGADGKDGVDGQGYELAYANTFESTTIKNIGGGFATRATDIGSFQLDAGKYLVQTDAIFTHNGSSPTVAPTLQAAVRVEDGSAWGLDAGTVFAGLPSPTPYEREAQGTSLRVITLTSTQTISVKGFGYNTNGSSAGGGGFDANVTVVVQKVG